MGERVSVNDLDIIVACELTERELDVLMDEFIGLYLGGGSCVGLVGAEFVYYEACGEVGTWVASRRVYR